VPKVQCAVNLFFNSKYTAIPAAAQMNSDLVHLNAPAYNSKIWKQDGG